MNPSKRYDIESETNIPTKIQNTMIKKLNEIEKATQSVPTTLYLSISIPIPFTSNNQYQMYHWNKKNLVHLPLSVTLGHKLIVKSIKSIYSRIKVLQQRIKRLV